MIIPSPFLRLKSLHTIQMLSMKLYFAVVFLLVIILLLRGFLFALSDEFTLPIGVHDALAICLLHNDVFQKAFIALGCDILTVGHWNNIPLNLIQLNYPSQSGLKSQLWSKQFTFRHTQRGESIVIDLISLLCTRKSLRSLSQYLQHYPGAEYFTKLPNTSYFSHLSDDTHKGL